MLFFFFFLAFADLFSWRPREILVLPHLMEIVLGLGIMVLIEFLPFRPILDIYMHHSERDVVDNILCIYSTKNSTHTHNVWIVHDLP